ncbi:hypothetical protein CQW23_22405 [Capsicum baccatum]|uniref:Uncharacterized protein n=1 Tax=Capsicum baccatum TaxID=33114 RepID=A0A2G2W0S2_CAPBA|nr:hypothetical protein CQW23_22405 [Capsicum baccatum]
MPNRPNWSPQYNNVQYTNPIGQLVTTHNERNSIPVPGSPHATKPSRHVVSPAGGNPEPCTYIRSDVRVTINQSSLPARSAELPSQAISQSNANVAFVPGSSTMPMRAVHQMANTNLILTFHAGPLHIEWERIHKGKEQATKGLEDLCMPNTRSSGQPLLPINLEPQRIGRMEAQRDIERRAAQQEQARLAALAAAQVHQQNINNPGRAEDPDDEDLGDDELLNLRRDAEVVTPANRRDRQARFRPERRAVQIPFDDDDDDLDGAGATGANIPPSLAPGAKFNITSTMIQL